MVHHLVEPSMLALAAAHTSEADFVRVVAELVSDISDLIHKRQVRQKRGEGRQKRRAARRERQRHRERERERVSEYVQVVNHRSGYIACVGRACATAALQLNVKRRRAVQDGGPNPAIALV